MLLFLPSIPALMDCAPSKLGLSSFCLLINVLFPQKTIESETVKTSEVIKKKLEEITGTVKESLDEVSRSDLGRKIKEGVEEAAKTAKQSAESVTRGGEKLGRTAAFKAISQGVETVKKEIDESVLGQTGPYRRPERLRKRTEYSGERSKEQRVFQANEEAMGMVLHKDSKWYQQWKDFKDNNVVFNRFFEMKMKYDESDNAFIRASRAVTDRVTDLIGGLFSKTEMSEVLTEILRVDPSFDKDRFLKQCERDIIPNVLEALISGELDILKDWCYEATYSQLAHPIQQAKALGLQFHSRILDIDNIDLAMGKMMEQGPVLIITFQAQVVMVIKNHKGDVVEGDPVSGWDQGQFGIRDSLGSGTHLGSGTVWDQGQFGVWDTFGIRDSLGSGTVWGLGHIWDQGQFGIRDSLGSGTHLGSGTVWDQGQFGVRDIWDQGQFGIWDVFGIRDTFEVRDTFGVWDTFGIRDNLGSGTCLGSGTHFRLGTVWDKFGVNFG
uniref:Mitochondrial import inner membrane translocase subunit TIM44 n=1 Tax=Ficedula albicollis TaxID=59894 RepID=A0A803V374_FICAL